MTRDELFLETVADLKEKLQSGSNYHLLKTAGLLRLLLLDNPSLLGQVQKGRVRGIRFKIVEVNPPAGCIDWFLGDGLDPNDSPPNPKIVNVTLPYLLSTVIIQQDGVDSSIKDVIRYVSHILGGIHAGSPNEDADIILKNLDEHFELGGGQATIYSLKAVSRVVLTALEPLCEKIIL